MKRFSDIFELDRSKIITDPDKFQGRQEKFSKDTTDAIVSKGFYDKSADPIIVWYDKEKDKYIVISGHSRFKATEILYESGKQPDLKTIPVKEYLGSETDARDYAILESNRGGTEEGLISDIKAYKRAISKGYNRKNLLTIFKPESKLNRLKDLSHLNERGKFLEFLSQSSNISFPYLERNATWVGQLRDFLPQLTDAHENEIFDYIYKGSGLKLEKEKLFKLIESKANNLLFDPEKPLNLENVVSTSAYTNPINDQIKELQSEIDKHQSAITKAQNNIARARIENTDEVLKLIPKFEDQINENQSAIINKIEQINKLKQSLGNIEKSSTFDLFSQDTSSTEKIETISEMPLTCPPIDKDGNIRTDQEGIELLKKCIDSEKDTFTLNTDPDGNFTNNRLKLHKTIIDEFKTDKPCSVNDPIAILTGGFPGAGKSSILKKLPEWIRSKNVVHIDADEIRAKLPEYKGWNAQNTHKETNLIVSKLLDSIGQPCEQDIVYDGTMTNFNKYIDLIKKLRKFGYKIIVVYVVIDEENSISRVLNRFKKTGRYVPIDLIKNMFKDASGIYKKIFDEVDGFYEYDGLTSKLLSHQGTSIPEKRKYTDENCEDCEKDKTEKTKKVLKKAIESANKDIEGSKERLNNLKKLLIDNHKNDYRKMYYSFVDPSVYGGDSYIIVNMIGVENSPYYAPDKVGNNVNFNLLKSDFDDNGYKNIPTWVKDNFDKPDQDASDSDQDAGDRDQDAGDRDQDGGDYEFKYPFTKNDIDYETAKRGHYFTSFDPEKRGYQEQEQYYKIMKDLYDSGYKLAKNQGKQQEYYEYFKNIVVKRAKSLYTAYLNARSRTMSSMITGSSKFPTERNRKKLIISDNKWKDFTEFIDKIEKYIKKTYTPDILKPVRTGQSNALEILEKKLESAEKLQLFIKDVNKIIKKYKSDVEGAKKEIIEKHPNLSEKFVYDLFKPDYMGRIGIPSYKLTNNGAEIRRLKQRIETEKKLQKQVQSEGEKEYKFELGFIYSDPIENRWKIMFNSIPDVEIRNKIKSRGFKWSPKTKFWVRQFNTFDIRNFKQYFDFNLVDENKLIEGTEIEKKEHGLPDVISEKIAEDHLKENPEYYKGEKIYINFLNKEKGFKNDKMYFNTEKDAIEWGKANIDRFNIDMINYEKQTEEEKPGENLENGKDAMILPVPMPVPTPESIDIDIDEDIFNPEKVIDKEKNKDAIVLIKKGNLTEDEKRILEKAEKDAIEDAQNKDLTENQVISMGRYINSLRSGRSQTIDNKNDSKKRLSPTRENLIRWAKNPGKFDLIGVDTFQSTNATADIKKITKQKLFNLFGIKVD